MRKETRTVLPTPTKCYFCGQNDGHQINSCLVATEYINNKKCMRNATGQIVLANNQPIPRGTPGYNLKDKIDTILQSAHSLLTELATSVQSPAVSASSSGARVCGVIEAIFDPASDEDDEPEDSIDDLPKDTYA